MGKKKKKSWRLEKARIESFYKGEKTRPIPEAHKCSALKKKKKLLK